MNWHQATFPSLKRRGGCGINKKMRSNQRAADGVVRPAKSSGLCTYAGLTTPSARTKVASRCFFDRASTPPFQGGEYAQRRTVLRGSKNHAFTAIKSVIFKRVGQY